MRSTKAANAPSLVRPVVFFAATAALLAMSARAPAHELPAVTPRAHAGEPMVRIRSADADRLAAVLSADRMTARTTHEAHNAALFVQADANQDGGVAALGSGTF